MKNELLRHSLVAFVFSVILSYFLIYFSSLSNFLYQQNRSFFYDPASYLVNNIFLYQHYLNSGKWNTIVYILNNYWNGGNRYLFAVLLNPEWLKNYQSYLISTSISVILFSSTFIYYSIISIR